MSEKAIFMGIMDCLKREAAVFCNRRQGRNGKVRYCPYARTDEEDGSVSCRLRRIEDLTKDCSCKMWFRTGKKRKKKDMTIGVKNRKKRHYGDETKDYLGTIYWDSSYKDTLYGRPRAHNCFRAEISINRKMSRFRSHDYGTCEMWLRMKTVEKLAAEGKPTREPIPPEVMKSIADFGEWMKFKGFAKHSVQYYMWRIKAICWVVGELSK